MKSQAYKESLAFGVTRFWRHLVWPETLQELCFSAWAPRFVQLATVKKDGGEPRRCPLRCGNRSHLRHHCATGAWAPCCRRGGHARGGGCPQTPPSLFLPSSFFYSHPKDTRGSLARLAAGATQGGCGPRLCSVISKRSQVLKRRRAGRSPVCPLLASPVGSPARPRCRAPTEGLPRSGHKGQGRPPGTGRGRLASPGRRSFTVQAGVQLGFAHHAVEGARVGFLAHLLPHMEGGPGGGARALQRAPPLA